MIKLNDIVSVELTPDEIFTIDLYCRLFFARKDIDHRASQFHYKGEKRNPNTTGIIGEWAFFKHYTNLQLHEFLRKRPYKKSDKGDGQSKRGAIFDIKTTTWHNDPKWMLEKPHYKGNVEPKHLEKKFLNAFVFVAYNPKNNFCHLMGQLEFNEFLKRAEFHRKGDVGDNKFVYATNNYDIRFESLDPIHYLTMDGIVPIQL